MSKENVKMEHIASLSKRRGFIYPGSDIYGGLSGTWDYGPLGVALKNNLKSSWWKKFVDERDDMFGLDAAIIMNPKVWQASGHVEGFSDPLGDGERFNTMFKTQVGAGEEAVTSYLRPETAQGIFVNFKNIIDSFHPKLPFGIGQIGKAFRNEIAPRDFIFRAREFEQMEIEYFTKEKDWQTLFEYWRGEVWSWLGEIGLEAQSIKELEVPEEDRAHYSKRTIDFEFDFPFGKRELCGLAYRTDFDLNNHSQESGVGLQYHDEETKEKFIPHCIEPTFGVDRLILAILSKSYTEDVLGGEKRTFLKLSTALAPYKVAVFPLLKNKPDLVKKAFHIYSELKEKVPHIVFDDNGNIGKRYRRQDEIGTPHCVTIDFQTLEDGTVTVRDRDSASQKRVKVEEMLAHL
jgi:glycyl-tRNA synthetase